MEKLLESCKLQKLMQEVTDNQNNRKAINITKFMIKIAPSKK